MSVRVLFLVEFQTYNLLLNWEMSLLGEFSKILPGSWELSFLLEKLLSDC